jgi:hypothetical protein
MELKLGLVGDGRSPGIQTLGWEILLRQIGVSYEMYNGENLSKLSEYAVCIVTDSVNSNYLDNIKDYVDDGGNIICSSWVLQQIIEIKTISSKIAYLVPDASGIFNDSELIDIFCKIQIPDGANLLKTNTRLNSVYRCKIGDGNIVAFPFDISRTILKVQSKKKSFYSNNQRLPYEMVSSVSKGILRRFIFNTVEYLFHSKKLPFVHLWYYPRSARSIFSFRIDTDYGSQQQIESLYQLSLKHNIPFTWFVDVGSQKEWINYFAQMTGQEIGLHCYEHKVHDSYADNYQNIGKALDIMVNAGINPKGFAAPFGRWNGSLTQAIRDHNFYYSSEFAYDYDNLPSYTVLNENPTSVLQVPIHPICIGSLRRQGFLGEEMALYFRQQVDKKLQLNEPIIFYHHPTHNRLEVIENILNYVKSKSLKIMKMKDYAGWWMERDKIEMKIDFEKGNLKISGENISDEVYIRITTEDGRETTSPISEIIDLSRLSFIAKPAPILPPNNLSRTRKFNKWMLINRIEDFFHANK